MCINTTLIFKSFYVYFTFAASLQQFFLVELSCYVCCVTYVVCCTWTSCLVSCYICLVNMYMLFCVLYIKTQFLVTLWYVVVSDSGCTSHVHVFCLGCSARTCCLVRCTRTCCLVYCTCTCCLVYYADKCVVHVHAV